MNSSGPKVSVAPLLLLLVLSVAVPALAEETRKDGSHYVILVTESDREVQSVFARYPELQGSFEDLAKFNLLRAGRALEIPKEMLRSEGVLAKIASFYGEAEVKRSWDGRYVPLVPHLLLQEGDEIRTWRGSGARILFEDGNTVLLRSQTRAQVVKLGAKQSPGSARLQLLLKEGGIWSQMESEVRGRFEVTTSTARTIIRGTEFRVKVESGEATRVEVLDGIVDFEVGERRLSVGGQEGSLATPGSESLTATPLPPSPAPAAPESEEVIRNASFDQIFQWAAVEGAEAYVLEIARDDRFFDLVVERSGDETSARVQNLEPGTYFWRVSSISGGFEGSPSDTRYFVFVAARP